MSVLAWTGAIAAVVVALAAVLALIVAIRAARAAEESNAIANAARVAAEESNAIANAARVAAERSAEAAEAHVELEMAKRAAQLFLHRAGPWTSSGVYGSILQYEIGNIGGSSAERVQLTAITLDDGTSYPLLETVGTVAAGQTVGGEFRWQVAVGARIPTFTLGVVYEDALGHHDKGLDYAART